MHQQCKAMKNASCKLSDRSLSIRHIDDIEWETIRSPGDRQ